MPETDREKSITIICDEIKFVLSNSDISAKLDRQRSGVKLGDFPVPPMLQIFERFSFYLSYDTKNNEPIFELIITDFNPIFGGTGEGGSSTYLRRKTASGRGSWNRRDQVSTPKKFTDKKIASMLLDHNVQPGDIKKTIQQTLNLV